MQFGLRTILLIAAVALFVLAWLINDSYADLLALGLVAFAGSFLVDALGMGDRTFGSSSGGTTGT
jgi:uncharacterized membrane protein YgdD (TMEM256/DUF423 family)